jgi:hypothetical protein
MQVPSGILQRKCDCGNHTMGDGQCESCSKEHRGTSQLKTSNMIDPNVIPLTASGVFGSPGRPLDAETRSFFEPRFGHDFSNVRVHADARAADAARTVNALAFTVGRDLFFGGGQFAPETGPGKRLLAHELTHVVQQKNFNATPQAKSLFSSSTDRAEQEASRVADKVDAGERVEIKQQPTAIVQGNGLVGAGIGAGIGALAGGLLGGLLGGPIGALIGIGAGALLGGLIGGLVGAGGQTGVQRQCAVLLDRVRAHPVYRALAAAVKAVADEIMTIALRRNNCVYYAENLQTLFDTPEAPPAAVGERNRQRVDAAAAQETTRLATPEAQQQLHRQEQAADASAPFFVERRGKNNKIFYVDRRNPNNIVVRIKIRLLAATGGQTTPRDLANEVLLEDAIERVAETRGYTVDVVFVNADGPDVFTFNIDFGQWPTSANPVGNARTLAHEIHHLMGLDDRYDYIESHAGNANMLIPARLHWFREQLNREPDPGRTTSLMGSGGTVLDDDACRVAGLDLQTCMAARRQGAAR